MSIKAKNKIPLIVVQFAKSPRLGHCKTRLAPALDVDQRNHLHIALTVTTSQAILNWGQAPFELWLDSELSHPDFDAAIAGRAQTRLQQGRTLGDKLWFTANDALARAESVIIVGSDCPFIDSDYLDQAAAALKKNKVVIGPATDGGYVLIGLNSLDYRLFDNIEWGTESVLAATLDALSQLNWRCQLLDEKHDIDLPEDLKYLNNSQLPPMLQEYKR